MDEALRDKLVNQSQASILEGILRGSIAGGIGGGALFATPTAVYGLTNPNKRLNRKEQMTKSLVDSAALGLVGAAGGSAIGGGVGLVSTILKKYVAEKKLKQLEKESSAKDYLIGGLSGAGIGTGAGMLMNVALGRRALSPGLLLGGAGVGGAIGLGIGHIKSQERDIVEKNTAGRDASVERDENGEVKMFDIEGNEVHKNEKGKWVNAEGVILRDQHSVGPRPKAGMYIGNHDSIDLLTYAPGGDKMKHMVPMLDNPSGHSDLYMVFDKPREFTFKRGDETVRIRTMKGPRGTNILKVGLGIEVLSKGGGDKDDRKGFVRMLPYQTNHVTINGIRVGNYVDDKGKDTDGFLNHELGETRVMGDRMHFLRAWDDNAPVKLVPKDAKKPDGDFDEVIDPEERRQWSHMNLFPVHDPEAGMSSEAMDTLARSIIGDTIIRNGDLGYYNIFPKWMHISQGKKGQGINMCNYYATGLTSKAVQLGLLKPNKKFTPKSPSVFCGGNIADNTAAIDEYNFNFDPSLVSVGDVIDETP